MAAVPQKRLIPQQPPPPPGIPERRQQFRRETDMENAETAEHAVQGAWLTARILNWGKIAAAGIAIAAVMEFGSTALNWRMWGTRDDMKQERELRQRADSALQLQVNDNRLVIKALVGKIDSLVSLQTSTNLRIERIQLIQCFQSTTAMPKSVCP